MGFRTSFIIENRNPTMLQTKQVITLYFDLFRLGYAAYRIRAIGPPYLKSLSISEITEMLRSFVISNFEILQEDFHRRATENSFEKIVSNLTKIQLTISLKNSTLLTPFNRLMAFPLVPVLVKDDYMSDAFSIVSPSSLLQLLPASLRERNRIDPSKFPPMKHYDGPIKEPTSWLIVPAPVKSIAYKKRSAILGGLALALPSRTRYIFTLRELFGGHCIFDDGLEFTYGDSHTPSVYKDIELIARDRRWLDIIDEILSSSTRQSRRKVSALEYFYRGWSLDETERFPQHCMALDALYGSGSVGATDAFVNGVGTTLSSPVDEGRLRLLMRIRGDFIHGRSPDVYDGENYAKYFKKYRVDPIRDLSLITERALANEVFGRQIRIQPSREGRRIADLQEKGLLPADMPSILD